MPILKLVIFNNSKSQKCKLLGSKVYILDFFWDDFPYYTNLQPLPNTFPIYHCLILTNGDTTYEDPGFSGRVLGLAGLEPLHVLPAALLELRQVGHVHRPGHCDQARAGGDWLAGEVGGRGGWGLGIHCYFTSNF